MTTRPSHLALRILIGSVWVFHGLYSKLLDGVPRHRTIGKFQMRTTTGALRRCPESK